MDHKQQIILQTLNTYFPNDSIKDQSKFQEGLNSDVYKITLNSNQILVAKVFNKKGKKNVEKDIEISKFLSRNGFKTAKVFAYDVADNEFGVILLEYLSGQTGNDLFQNNQLQRSKLMLNFGRNLTRIHALNSIPQIWQNSKTSIKTSEDWKLWILTRIDKYLLFFNDKLSPQQLKKIAVKLNILKTYINEIDIQIVPLHSDYRLGNVLVNEYAEILSTLDFENAMPGDALADLGQALYWQIFKFGNDIEIMDIMLDGYFGDKNFETKEVIEAYGLLHLLAVTRSNWDNQNLKWLKDKHLEMLDTFI